MEDLSVKSKNCHFDWRNIHILYIHYFLNKKSIVYHFQYSKSSSWIVRYQQLRSSSKIVINYDKQLCKKRTISVQQLARSYGTDSGSKGGDNGSNFQFLGVSDFEFSSFWLSLGTSASNAALWYGWFKKNSPKNIIS